jgi:PAB1-binding protein PBP1
MYVSVGCLLQDVLLSGDTLPNGRACENRVEIVTDAVLSQVPHRELERELMPWKPDDDTSKNLSLNFNELYTTKLERGPLMREREREALRIAHEIERQTTHNIHLAERVFQAC